MTDDFDPYYTWLGIPPEDQPATHYRLLGVREFEPSLDVISNAGDQRMAYLRTFQVGKRSALSQRLLNEMAAAKVCLLDADQRKAYDAKLKASKPKPVAPAPQIRTALAPKISAAPSAPLARQPIASQLSPKYPPSAPTLAPARQVPVTRPMPVAALLPSVTPDPFAAVDPFADAAKEVQSQPVLPAKPAAAASDDFSDQATAMVRAAVSRMQESPLATAAYGMLALGVVMLLAVSLWVAFGRGQPRAVAGVPSAPANAIPNTPQQPQNLPSTTAIPAVKNPAPETPKTVAKPELPATLPSEGPKASPSTSPPPAVPPAETVPEIAVKPNPVPPVTPAPTKNPSPPAPEPASAPDDGHLQRAAWQVLVAAGRSALSDCRELGGVCSWVTNRPSLVDESD